MTEDAVAIILGGAECWQDDLTNAKALLDGHALRYFIINDHIRTFPETGIAVTLHPEKLARSWLPDRRAKGLPEPEQIWSHRADINVTHNNHGNDWGGSSGLFAVMIARKIGFKKIILCGVGMTTDGNHFVRHQRWNACAAFWHRWQQYIEELKPVLRSMSGRTRDVFGAPDQEFLNG